MKGRGLFITLEGGEGVGKSTSRAFLHEFLSSRGVDLVETREPGGTPLGEDIRGLLLQVRREPMAINTELLLIFAARAQHIAERIEPALAAGKWVLCDRFTDATIAYQCGGRGVATSAVKCLEELVQGELRPDYTLLLDAAIATGMERARARGELDRIEQETVEFFERVRASYLEQARNSSGRYRLIDADQPLAQVQATLECIGHELLAAWKVRQGNT